VAAIRVKECGNNNNSCNWGNKYLQLISTPLAAWLLRFLPLVSDSFGLVWGGGSTFVERLKCISRCHANYLLLSQSIMLYIFLDHNWSNYVLSHGLDSFCFILCHILCILLFNTLCRF
jgi:hypothetical protein